MSKGIVIYVEGETDEEYQKVKEVVRIKCVNERFDKNNSIIKIINLSGIGNYKNSCLRNFKINFKDKYPQIQFHVYLCYDTDAFEFSKKPPVNMKAVEKELLKIGAKEVTHIKAKHSIEDWFMCDLSGILNFLNAPKVTKLNAKKGYYNLSELFRKHGKIYDKGKKVKGFLGSLDIKKIMRCNCKSLCKLCNDLGSQCEKDDNYKC